MYFTLPAQLRQKWGYDFFFANLYIFFTEAELKKLLLISFCQRLDLKIRSLLFKLLLESLKIPPLATNWAHLTDTAKQIHNQCSEKQMDKCILNLKSSTEGWLSFQIDARHLFQKKKKRPHNFGYNFSTKSHFKKNVSHMFIFCM